MPTINNRFENLTLERLQEIYDLVVTGTTSNVLIDGGTFLAAAENVLIDAGTFI